MIIALQIFFWLAAFMLIHSYMLYPLILEVLMFFKNKKQTHTETQLPGISILMSVYNEEKIIAQKLDSILQSNYPQQNIEIIIGSDCSTDNTENIITDYSKNHPQIKLQNFKERKGKPQILNELINLSSFDYVIFTDANVLFDKDNIRNLAQSFSKDTGLVGSTIINHGLKEHGISRQEGSYIKGENRIKYNEGFLWGTMMGPFGGCFMIRKNLFETIPPNFIVDDFYLSMIVLEKKYKCVCSSNALCYEDVSDEMSQEFKRKKRISAGNYQNLKRFASIAKKPFTNAGFCFLSHKVFRWWGPFAIIICGITLLALSFYLKFYLLLLAFYSLFLFMPLFDFVQKKMGINNFIIRLSSYFVYMNIALLSGYIQYKKGIKTNVWNRTERVV